MSAPTFCSRLNEGIGLMKFYVSVISLVLTGCVSATPSTENAQLANPASTYCVEQGGTVEIRKEAAGKKGYCRLPDGRVVEEWELFRSQSKD